MIHNLWINRGLKSSLIKSNGLKDIDHRNFGNINRHCEKITAKAYTLILILRINQKVVHCGDKFKCCQLNSFNPLSPHNALTHHFTSLKTDLIFLQLGVLEWKFPWHWFTNTSNHLHPLQVENCDSNSRLVVDEDDNDKFRLERVKCKNYM